MSDGARRTTAERGTVAEPEVLELVEFTRVREWLASLTSTPLAAARAGRVTPSADPRAIADALAALAEGKELAASEGPWPGPPPFEVRPYFEGEARAFVSLPGRALFQLAELLAAVERAGHYWDAVRERAPHAARRALGLAPDPELERRLRVSVGPDGEVLDTASPELAAIRKQQGVLRGRLREKLERYRSLAAEEGSFVTQRNERFVVAVRADRFERSRGLVHDVSASGSTLFVEPFEICALNNELREAAARERDESARLLRALSELVRVRGEALLASEEALAETDLLWARVRLSRELDGHTPRVVAGGETLRFARARHPLLGRGPDFAPEAEGALGRVVPLELVLAAPRRLLLVSGPNMGGKTVALKTVGLLVLMAQAGLDVPAAEGAELPLFETVDADIGDAQSIAAHLSTFAAHLKRLDGMARRAGPAALLLVDEIGAGTDPAEGAALGRALLKHFARRDAWAVATTHLGSLKLLAEEEPAVVNGSMALDPVTFEPRFELVIGVPGGSHALAVAERLGFHAGVLAEAYRELPEAARSLEALLADLAAEHVRAREARAALEAAEARAAAQAVELAATRRGVADGARAAEKQKLLEIRVLEGQVQALLRELKAEARSEEKSRARIQEIEARARSLGRESDRLLTEPPPAAKLAVIRPGVTVFVRDLGVTARVVEGPDADGRVLLERGAWRIQSRADQCLAPSEEAAPEAGRAGQRAAARSGTGGTAAPGTARAAALPEAEPTLEVDVRGLDQEDALSRVEEGLDRALLAGLADLRIIHGVGKGVLREAIARALRSHPHVAGSRLGVHGEGGRGVTVARLR